MISIDLGSLEYFDGSTNTFVYEEAGVVRFEYSLKALYEWESKWKKPFLKGNLNNIEALDFYLMMALDPVEAHFITEDVQKQLNDYIKDSPTATVFNNRQNADNPNNKQPASKIYSAEEIYALMFSAGVDLEFENRNLNRLLIILRIIGNYNNPPKKMSKEEILRDNRALNAQRRAAMKTRG